MNKSISGVPALLYLVPVFFVNVQLGYSEVFLRLHYVVYPILIGLLLYGFVREKNFVQLFLGVGVLLLFLMVNFAYYVFYSSYFNSNFILSTITATIIFGLAILLSWNVDASKFLDVFENFSKFTVVVVMASYAIYKITGISVLSDPGYGLNRPHAFMSEPSALAVVVTYLVCVSFYKSQWGWLLLSLVSVYVCQSLIVMISVLITATLLWINSVIRSGRGWILLVGSLFILFFVGFLEGVLIDYFPDQYMRLESGIRSITSLGDEGYNPRMIIAIAIWEAVSESGAHWFGMGLNSVSYYNVINLDWLLSAASFPFFLYMSFGVVGLLVFYGVVFFLCFRVQGGVQRNMAFLFALLVVTTINAAQGMIIYGLLVFYTSCLFFKYRNVTLK